MGSLIAVRSAHDDDAAGIADLLNALARSDDGEGVVTPEEITHWLRIPAVEFWVAEGPGRELVAYADVAERAGRTRYWIDLREHPERRQLGGARALLTALEERAREKAADGALLRGTFAASDAPLRTLYEETGFRLVRHGLEMRIGLGAHVPDPEWPEGIKVREFVPGEDDEQAHEAHMEAFEDHWEHAYEPFPQWHAEHLGRPGIDPSLWFLAEKCGAIAALSLCREHPSGDPAFGYVEVLGVRRAWRRQGLGLALLRHAFLAFRARGMTRAALDVDAANLTGAVRLYERAGMHVAKRSDTYEKAL
jgi:mycothiol synthase